jgi:imidazoleglycerol phosphate dehydratase HisB
LRALGLEPLPSATNFLFVPVDEADALAETLLRSGLVVRVYANGVRFSVRDREDDDLLLDALARALDRPSPAASPSGRRARHLRATAETRIRVRLGLDGAGRVRVATGAGLYDHLLEQLAFHAGFDLVLEGVGDLETGEHHTAEDAALALGEALDAALGDRRGIARYGDAVVPMDDALARAAVDLGGRPASELRLERDPGLAEHVLRSFAQAGRLAVNVESSGRDDHHVAEAAFKAVGRALRAAVRVESTGVPSTKGVV